MTGSTTHEEHHLRELPAEECWALVRSQSVGRLVWHGEDGLTAVPVNYAVDDEVLLIRTTAYSAITRDCDDSAVAFEVDWFDPATKAGWSVLLRGRAVLSFGRDQASQQVDTWPSGLRPVHLRLDPHTVTGRRLASL